VAVSKIYNSLKVQLDYLMYKQNEKTYYWDYKVLVTS